MTNIESPSIESNKREMFSDFRRNSLHVSAAKCLIVFALCWSQLAFALHEAHHHAAESAESCVVCIQLDRVDDTLATANCISDEPQSAAVLPALPSNAIGQRGDVFYRARASP